MSIKARVGRLAKRAVMDRPELPPEVHILLNEDGPRVDVTSARWPNGMTFHTVTLRVEIPTQEHRMILGVDLRRDRFRVEREIRAALTEEQKRWVELADWRVTINLDPADI